MTSRLITEWCGHRWLAGLAVACCGCAAVLGAEAPVAVAPAVVLPGSLHADQTARIGARVGGYLVELPVDIGSVVKKDEVLGKIGVPELEQQRKATEASLGELRAKRAAAEAASKADASEAARTAQLARSGAVTPKARDEAQERAGASAAALAAAEAACQTAEAKVGEIETMIRYATLRAPFDGVVTTRDCETGDLIAAGRPAPLFSVAKVDVMRFRVAVPEKVAVGVAKGATVNVTLDALGSGAREGKVARTAGAIDPLTRTMTVEIELSNTDGKLIPGLSGHATFPAAGPAK